MGTLSGRRYGRVWGTPATAVCSGGATLLSHTRAACTIVARNYLAQARVLVRSFERHHPDVTFTTLVIDGDESDRTSIDGVGRVMIADDLGLAPHDLHSMMLIYDVMELATALKPSMLQTLLREGANSAIYFDPDIEVFAPLGDVFESAAESAIVVTPHTLSPIPRDGKWLAEHHIMHAGMFNLGFIAVGRGATTFLAWWHERLRTDAISDIGNALFTDQRWVDWVPSLFPHLVSRDRGLNAAYWNLHERSISVRDGVRYAGSDPLRFYHFSGFDPETPWLLSKHIGDNPRTLLSTSPGLRELCRVYAEQLHEFDHPRLRKSPYGFDVLPNGLPIERRVRRLVRDVVVGDLQLPAPPDAFADPTAFADWLTAPSIGPALSSLSPAQYSIWRERHDLRTAFPDVLGADSVAFRSWCDHDQNAREWLSHLASFCSPRTTPSQRARRAFGWSVIAYANSELGVGEAGRRTASAVAGSGIPMELVSTTHNTLSRAAHAPRRAVSADVSYENVVTCVNADQLPTVSGLMGLESLRGRHVGLWFWELEEFPTHYRSSLDLVDEVWVASEFTRKAIQAVTDVPVRLIAMPIEVPTRPTSYTRRSLGLPEGCFLFVSNFDYLSVYERKNPISVIRAYTEAFTPNDGTCLLVKSINGHHRPLHREHIRSFAEGRADIVFLDDYVTNAEMKAIIELSDCYVSLHRAEGYGLNLADAMAHGTPTIATGYSGNMEFQTPETAVLIPYSLVEVGPAAAPYSPTAWWADPDVEAASAAMLAMAHHSEAGRQLAARALDHVTSAHSLAAAAASMTPALMGLSKGII